MRYLSIIVWIILALLALVFTTLNSQAVEVYYYFGSVHVLLPLLLLFSIVVGVLLGWVAFFPRWFKQKTKNRQLRGQVKNLEVEVTNLRNIPIQDNH